MQTRPGHSRRRYADYQVFGFRDDKRRVFRLDRFRFQCQTDNRRAEAYGWHWGYQPEHGSIFTAQDFQHYGSSVAAITRVLERLNREDGAPEAVGRFVVRLARALKLDGIALLETSRNGSFHDDMEIRRCIELGAYGDAIRLIDGLVLELHQACADRMGKRAA